MRDYLDCIQGKLDARLIKKETAESLQDHYDTMVKQAEEAGGDIGAAGTAAEQYISIQLSNKAKDKLNKIRHAVASVEIRDKIYTRYEAQVAEWERLGPVRRALVFTPKLTNTIRDYLEEVNARVETVTVQILSPAEEFFRKYRSQNAGLSQDAASTKQVVRAMLGESINDPNLGEFGTVLNGVMETVNRRYTAAGGIMGHLKNYFPQSHDAGLVRKGTRQGWVDYLMDGRMDRDKMLHPERGTPYTDAELREILPKVWDDITTYGASRHHEAALGGRGMSRKSAELSKRRSSSRFIHFKDADSFFEYNQKFGAGDSGLFDALSGHINVMSRDIAMMEKMGPKPDAVFSNLMELAKGGWGGRKVELTPAELAAIPAAEHAALPTNSRGKPIRVEYAEGGMKLGDYAASQTGLTYTQGTYDVLAGRLATTGGESTPYKIFTGYQDWLRHALLGTAPVAALSDTAYAGLAAKMMGLDSTRTIGRYINELTNLSDSKQAATQAAHTLDVMSGHSAAAARFGGEASGVRYTSLASAFTHRASGLEHMTQAVRNAVTLELAGKVAKDRNKLWADLDTDFRNAMREYDIAETDWNIIRSAELMAENGAEYINHLNVARVSSDSNFTARQITEAAAKLGDMDVTLRNIASNTPTLRTRAMVTGAALGMGKSGTLGRAGFSSFFLFKSFPITAMVNHVFPHIGGVVRGNDGALGKAAYMLVGTWLLGAASVQLSELIKGRTPMDMSDPRFWIKGLLKGGGGAFYADFLFADYSSYGRNILVDMAGPTATNGNAVLQATIGNFQKAMGDSDYDFMDEFLADSAKILQRHAPAQSLWQTRLLMERSIFDQINKRLDDRWYEKQQGRAERLYNDTNQEYWWTP